MKRKNKTIVAIILIGIYIVVPFLGGSFSSHWEAWGMFNIVFAIALWELLFKEMFGFKEFLE